MAVSGVAATTIAGYAAATSAVAGVAGAGLAYMGANSSAAAASNTEKYNAAAASNNQEMADQAAVVAQQQGAVQQQLKANQEDVLIGQQKAALAANGVDVGSGTAVDLMSDTKAAGELDELTITNNAARESTGYLNQGESYSDQATVDEAASQAALTGGALQGASSLVTGAGTVSNTWLNYTRALGNTPAQTKAPQPLS